MIAVSLVHQPRVHFGREIAYRLLCICTQRRIHNANRAATGPVVGCQYTQHLAGARYLVRLHERGRTQHAVAKIAGQASSVRIDGPQTLDRNRRAIDVFPAAVNDPPILHHRRREIVEIIGRETLHVATIAITAVQDRRRRCPAVGKSRFAIGEKRDRVVRQPARIEIVGVVIGQLLSAPCHPR